MIVLVFPRECPMIQDSPPVPLGTVLADFGRTAVFVAGEDAGPSMPVSGAVIWMAGEDVSDDAEKAIICPRSLRLHDLAHLVGQLSPRPRVLFLIAPLPFSAEEIQAVAGENVVVLVEENFDVADVVVTISRSLLVPEEAVSRRLASLQRSLSQAVSDPDPIAAVLSRLARVCNATAVLVDRSGRTVHATGPIPMSMLFDEITRTEADSQKVDVGGWCGVAARITAPVQSDSHYGWLVVTTRRQGFPDAYSTSAVHVAATLVEASQRMAVVARKQERAIRTAVLEEALALRREPNNPELAGRISAFGLSFEDELRTIVFQPIRSSVTSRSLRAIEDIGESLGKALEAHSVPYLMTVKNKAVTFTAQCSVQALRRIVIAAGSGLPNAHIGVGRSVRALGDILDSYQDAQLAVRTLRRNSRGPKVMSYEDFDYATRLFADVGFDKMIAWAQEFLKPLEGRDLLIEGLQTYFEHSQNINAAADFLEIHHNSLRYRLAKAEEILSISLREPAAISSIFLALTALELGQVQQARPRSTGDAGHGRKPSDVEAADFLPYSRPPSGRGGVVHAPGR